MTISIKRSRSPTSFPMNRSIPLPPNKVDRHKKTQSSNHSKCILSFPFNTRPFDLSMPPLQRPTGHPTESPSMGSQPVLGRWRRGCSGGGGWSAGGRSLRLHDIGGQLVLKSDGHSDRMEGEETEEEEDGEEEDGHHQMANGELARAEINISCSISVLQALKQELALLKDGVPVTVGVDLGGGHGSDNVGPHVRFQTVRDHIRKLLMN